MQELDIYGEGGKGGGGGGGHTPVETNDTLQSVQVVRILLAVSEGEINSIDEIYLNRTPISAFDATYEIRTGTTNQTVIPGFVNTESPLSGTFPIEVQQALPLPAYSIDSTADAARVTLVLQALSQYLENGDLVGYEVSLSIYTSPNNSTYTLAKTTVKNGKSSTDYAWDVQVERPSNYIPGSNWYIKVVRNTADSTSVKINDTTLVAGISQIYYKNLNYPGTALVGITLRNADQFGGQVPEILLKGKFLKVKVPNNYDPTSRVYSGNWNLGFNPVKQFTANIAWIIFYCLNDSKALNISEADIDKASFYELSQYADQMIDDGFGGTIPRYTVGYQFVSRDNVPSFLANLLSICNANLGSNEFGQISIIFDHPNVQPSKLVTNANVIDGLFNYSSNDLEGRTTQVNVTYNDWYTYGDTSTASVPGTTPTTFEQGLIDRYSLQPSDIVLPGCLHEAQAVRKARWALYTNCITTRFISFKVFLHGLTYRFGEVIKVMDSENRQTMQHGVILSYSYLTGTTTLVLDREFTLSASAWTISFTGSDGVTLYNKTINETAGLFSSVSFTGQVDPFIGSVIILNGPLEGKLYTVTGIQKEDDYYVIAGIERDEGKFDYVDDGIVLDVPTGDFVNPTDFTVEPVVNLSVSPISSTDGINSNIQLHVFWDWDLDHSAKYKATFVASWRRDKQDFKNVQQISGYSFDIDAAVPGTYEINVWAINSATNVKSSVNNLVYNYRTSIGTSTLLPPINASTSNTTSTFNFSTPALTLFFYNNPANTSNVVDSLYDYVVEVWDSSGITKYATYTVNPDANKDGVFSFPFSENVAVFGTPTRQFQIKLYSRDLSGFFSTAYAFVVNNAVPADTSFSYSIAAGVGAAYFNINASTEGDVVGYIIHRSLSNTFSSYDVFDVGGNTIPSINGESSTTYYYRMAAYDTFGKTGLDFGSTISNSLLSFDATQWTKDGLEFSVGATNRIDWTSGNIYKNGVETFVIAAGNATWTTGKLYVYFNPSISTTSLQFTNILATAVSVGSYPLATYTGGDATNILGGDGSAFISGSQIIAGTVGASELIVGSAVITGSAQIAAAIINTGHIQDAAINNAKIGDVIQSASYNVSTKTGWKIDKTGNITSYGSFFLGSSGTGNARMEITGQAVKVYDSSGVLRVQLGDLSV